MTEDAADVPPNKSTSSTNRWKGLYSLRMEDVPRGRADPRRQDQWNEISRQMT
eukprot:CAMPEP_0202458962 /NCGR_PEP_ID=MMETSP1360-20130828/28708_1 /ASSEMBLY_ACC=CAM_ASM_000848 /TAXON_ID=515479 /ORGANISM="Licmophora paradoxa, Strain CCMP2313" /LENGTH=52 /DNA_ID=CAMNT_0049079735 /DNA_START=244 /DNA_END=402 /DNA_ORIENTATION=-